MKGRVKTMNKNIFYSPVMKGVAFLLILFFGFVGIYRFGEVYTYTEPVLNGEENLQYKLWEDIANTFNYAFAGLGVSARTTDGHGSERVVYVENINYYAQKADKKISNFTGEEGTEIQNIVNELTAFYGNTAVIDEFINQGGVILKSSGGNVTIYHTHNRGYMFLGLPTEDILVLIKPSEVYMNEYMANIESAKAEFDEMKDLRRDKYSEILIYIACIIIAAVYLFWVLGRNGRDDAVNLLLIDRMYIEVGIFLAGAIFIASILALSWLGYSWYDKNYGSLGIAAIGTIGGAMIFTILLSFARNLKNRSFLKRSVIYIIVRKLYLFLRGLFSNARKLLSDKAINLFLAYFIGYCFLMVVFAKTVIIPIGLTVTMVYFAQKKLIEFEELRKGIDEVRCGNNSYKINSTHEGIIGDMCRKLDNIGEGINIAVESRMKAERMKTELITNVSHDLKTPLTSIINYSKILKGMELEPREANDYIKIIEQKALKLKSLTSDLFDISKVQSGNEIMNIEEIDLGVLINQALAELDAEIKERELIFKADICEGIIIKGDGEKLSRVFENLFINAVKYSLGGTRVYVEAEEDDAYIVVSVKNISAYPLDFNEEEITERFVRGDESRSGEGSGLGLAIAKSYLEAMGAGFRVVTDGDLFKAIITWEKSDR